MTDSINYDVFISYARVDNATGWVTVLRDAIYEDFAKFSTEPFRIFLDQDEIHARQDWELRLRQGLRTSRVLLVCLSPDYLRSEYCKWEWNEFAQLRKRRIGGGDAVTGVFFVELGGDHQYDADIAAWRDEVTGIQLVDLRPWYPEGTAALQEADVRQRVATLGRSVHDQLREARLAQQAPGNLRRHNTNFVGRTSELQALRSQLTGGAVGVVTAVHGIGGMGKTELAVTYAHLYAHSYQGGTWQVAADGQTDMLEAVSALALSPELGLEVLAEHLADRQWLGQRVLARLAELTADAAARDDGTSSCLLLLDNVSEPDLLSESQLATLPDQPWLHVVATTRLGGGDVAAAGARGSIAMIEVDRLDADDALELIRGHQPARDADRLHPDFSSPQERDAARQIVELIDSYPLAVEHAAVYLGSGFEPSELLQHLQTGGIGLLDDVGASPAGTRNILHKDKIVGRIVDQTLDRLPERARSALTFAALLPPDTIPWRWVKDLTEVHGDPAPKRLPGLSLDGDWTSIQRILEGRRLLTPSDDPRFVRVHRVLHEHFRHRLADAAADRHMDRYLTELSGVLQDTATPDIAMLDVITAAVTARLTEGHHDLALAGHAVFHKGLHRIDPTATDNLAVAIVNACEQLAAAEPDNADHRHLLSLSLEAMGDLVIGRGQGEEALQYYGQSLHVRERLIDEDPENANYQRCLSLSVGRVGAALAACGREQEAAREYLRARDIVDKLVTLDPDSADYQRDLYNINDRLANLENLYDDGVDLRRYEERLATVEELVARDPDNPKLLRDLWVSLNSVGFALIDLSDVETGFERLGEALQIGKKLVALDPYNIEYQRDFANGLTKLANRLAEYNADASLEYRADALRILEGLVTVEPDNTRYLDEIAITLGYQADYLYMRGDLEACMQHRVEAIHYFERLTVLEPAKVEYQSGVCALACNVAENLESAGHPSAVDYWEKAHRALTAIGESRNLADEDRQLLDQIADKLGL